MDWVEKSFPELGPTELHGILRLRQRVFVVEQQCVYLDADGHDAHARHLWLPQGSVASPSRELAGALPSALANEPAAYLRILPPGAAYLEPSLGRVITAPEVRGRGLGVELLREGLARAWARYGLVPIRIGAQAHLEGFYGALGFRRASEDYVEDGIRHLEMLIPGG
ncbi:MAG TPA: GNAT family N-acetyltransferase [Kofleriaceae bacterium]|nr:GNAT family N-acetyltransferase [Kofleriaceae bacterium]